MPTRPIGIFDSGIGGLSVVKAITQLLPQESLLYFGDTAHVPYGPQSPSTIQAYSLGITQFLLDQGCKAIVVACNTATTAAISTLRDHWPDLPILGMEPAVKPGAKATRTGKVAVLATAGTFSSQRYTHLMEEYASGVQLLENPCVGLVGLIERGVLEGPVLEAFLRPILDPMLEAGADTFVLGCTHYPLILPTLRKLLGTAVHIIDPAPALAKQLQRVLDREGLLLHASLSSTEQVRRFYTSGGAGEMKTIASEIIGEEAIVLDYQDVN